MPTLRALAPWSLALLLSLGACAKMDAPNRVMPAQVTAAVPLRAGEALPAADRAMRITVETTLEVTDLPAASGAVRAAVARAGGYVGEARTAGSDEARSASFEAHVPVAALPAFRAEIGKLGEVAVEAEKAEDVTEQRADINARLGNARAEEKRLLELLEKRTGTLADVVAVEKELASVRETVERMEAQQRVLEGQIALATVRVSLSVRHAGGHVGPGRRVVQAAGDGVQYAGSFLLGLAVLVVSSAPTLAILLAIGYAVFRVVRALARRSRPTPPPR